MMDGFLIKRSFQSISLNFLFFFPPPPTHQYILKIIPLERNKFFFKMVISASYRGLTQEIERKKKKNWKIKACSLWQLFSG